MRNSYNLSPGLIKPLLTFCVILTIAFSIQYAVHGSGKKDITLQKSAERSIPTITTQKVSMIIPGGYELGTFKDIQLKNYLEFYYDHTQASYRLGKAKYKIRKSYDDCNGYYYHALLSARNCLFYIDMPGLKQGSVKSIDFGSGYIAPDLPFTLNFNGSLYTFRVQADSSDRETVYPNEEYGYWRNYSMTMTRDDSDEILLFDIPQFEDCVLKILFAGDIDADGKLDLVFDSKTWYEDTQTTLFLSSVAPNNIIVRAGECLIAYSC